MQKNTRVTHGPHFEQFIAYRIAQGRYGSASEAIGAGLRLLEAQELKLSALRRALEDGDARGRGRADYLPSGVLAELDSRCRIACA
jgi:antitoxin ParD1/3/4